MERNGRFTFGWCISYRPFHNPPRKEVEANLHKNLGFLCQSNKKQDHLPLFRLIRTLGTQFFVIFRSPVINL